MNVYFRSNVIAVRVDQTTYFWDTTFSKAFEILKHNPTCETEGPSAIIRAGPHSERLMSRDLLRHAVINTTQQLTWKFSPSEVERTSERLDELCRGLAFLDSMSECT